MELGSLTKGRVWEMGAQTALIFETVSGEEDAHSYARGYSATGLAISKKGKKVLTHILTLSRSKRLLSSPTFVQLRSATSKQKEGEVQAW